MSCSPVFRISVPALLVFFLVGCTTTRSSRADIEAQQRALAQQQQRAAEERRQQMRIKVADTESQLAEAQMQIRNLRAELNQRPTAQDLEVLRNRIAGMETMLRDLEARRKRDREELLNTLSQRMAAILAQQQSQARASGRAHTVAAGETLSAIAAAYRVRSADIIRINNLSNPNALRVGQKLTIPAN